MFTQGSMQTDSNTGEWLWFVILGVLILLSIVWWLSRRRVEPAAAASAAPARRNDRTSDDLTRIEGIGPRVAQVLNDAGVTTFEELAESDPNDIKQTLNEAGLQMMKPEGWIEQARLAANGDWEAMQRLQDELKGGRRR